MTNIRNIIYTISIVMAAGIYWLFPRYTELLPSQLYGIGAFILLYLTLLVSPLYNVFPRLPYKNLYLKARKALGISSFFYALLHTYLSFWNIVGGFKGLAALDQTNYSGVFYGVSALLILTVLAVTSLRYFVLTLRQYWKYIHRFIYLAGFAVLLHVTTVTVHLNNKLALFKVGYVFVLILFLLEMIRFDKYIFDKYRVLPKFTITLIAFPIFTLWLSLAVFG